MEKIAAYTLRPVQEEDEELLLELYSSTRADEIGVFELFIVPIRRDDQGFYYEAVFNRMRQEGQA
jgi:hypothetical protein